MMKRAALATIVPMGGSQRDRGLSWAEIVKLPRDAIGEKTVRARSVLAKA